MTKIGDIKVFVKPYDTVSIGEIPEFVKSECKRLKDAWKIRQKKAAYSLLCEVLTELSGIEGVGEHIVKNAAGKPELFYDGSALKFSISHSHDLVAVAVSDSDVGVDIEKIREVASQPLLEKICNNDEKKEILKFSAESCGDITQDIIKTWSKKEALYKTGLFGDKFLPQQIDTVKLQDRTFTKELEFNEEKYVLSVAFNEDLTNKKAIYFPFL